MKYESFFKKHLSFIEKNLSKELLVREVRPKVIHQAMQYSVFTGGKRFRPVLALASCEACGGKLSEAILPAMAIELIHTYSLIHDDLPALDNDDLRRGKPTSHKKFGEANAILAGDGLLTLAFELLAGVRPAERAVRLLGEISTAAGVHGMIGGQVADLEVFSRSKTLAEHDFICEKKTGQLIRVSALAGAIAAGAGAAALKRMACYGECLGLAFQVVDDILDGDGYCRVLSKAKTVQKAERLIQEAKKIAESFGSKAKGLVFLADFLASRMPG
ncbi:MAG TPA: polyprenyl synthetase family protein [Candidatus Omnitrophota bacterium]|nr:polyprenyl synthetase family protein [Candidatus Omnitrophota bacterium]HPS37016.1 polyprenyl synthetase family protein [Candidatus Omnitrophota bacterium]